MLTGEIEPRITERVKTREEKKWKNDIEVIVFDAAKYHWQTGEFCAIPFFSHCLCLSYTLVCLLYLSTSLLSFHSSRIVVTLLLSMPIVWFLWFVERAWACMRVCVCVRLCFFPMWVESNRKNWKKKSNKLEDTRWDRAPGMSHTNRIGSYLFVLLSVSLIAVHVVHAYTLTWHCHAIQTERHTIEKTPKRASLKARRRQSLHHLHTPTEQSNRIQKPPSYRS